MYEQLKVHYSFMIDWVVESIPRGVKAEYVRPNAVCTIDQILMTQELYFRSEDIRYLGKIGQSGTEPKGTIICR